MTVYKLMAQLPSIREMAKNDLREASEKVDGYKLISLYSRVRYSKFGAFSKAIGERLRVYLKGTSKNDRPRMKERCLKKYNAIDFSLDGAPFYANMETIDELLQLIQSYYE